MFNPDLSVLVAHKPRSQEKQSNLKQRQSKKIRIPLSRRRVSEPARKESMTHRGKRGCECCAGPQGRAKGREQRRRGAAPREDGSRCCRRRSFCRRLRPLGASSIGASAPASKPKSTGESQQRTDSF